MKTTSGSPSTIFDEHDFHMEEPEVRLELDTWKLCVAAAWLLIIGFLVVQQFAKLVVGF